MSEHLALRSSVGSRSSALPSHHHHQHLVRNPDPLASDWIRRLHLIPNPPPPPPLARRAAPPSHQDAVSTDESRTPPPPRLLPQSSGFGPFRWSIRPSRGAPVGTWDATAVSGGASSGCSQPMLSPFFRLPAPPPVTTATDIRETTPVSSLIRLGSSSGGYTGPSTQMVGGGNNRAPWFAARDAGAAYPSHALDMVPIRTLNDLHDRQHGMMPQHFARHDPSSSSQHDEPFSYWNMGRFRRNTTTSSISPIAVDVVSGNFGNKRNADSTSFLPLKIRKLSGAI
ncbi:hypothetical protein PR202_gb11371 [Eleusine coracana subsp. coracana]|uniref:Uncharacterized protein n=1 Tax=Eleusine coracana subsp. coracana TaxID=191504 RepID=A0AAV5ELM1_ELECO|nr:hypothetical protein PR202_gb11371 [Eleusine coracana subsp. coracana]